MTTGAVNTADPRSAPPRVDLPFLRHRGRRSAPAPNAALSEFLSGHASHHPPAPQPVLVADRPTPVTPAVTAPVLPPSSTSLDLSTAARPEPAARAQSTPRTPATLNRRVPPDTRAISGQPTILTGASPTVTLTRMQSGIGTLSIEAACSDAVGDLRLGCAFALTSGHSSTVQPTGGARFGPRDSRRPIIIGQRDRFERLTIDLRQAPSLQRMAVYAFSASGTALRWGGTLVVTTYGGAAIEVPLDLPTGGTLAVLLTIYNVAGELVLRSELAPISGAIRDACLAYGYDRITWLDDHSPVL